MYRGSATQAEFTLMTDMTQWLGDGFLPFSCIFFFFTKDCRYLIFSFSPIRSAKSHQLKFTLISRTYGAAFAELLQSRSRIHEPTVSLRFPGTILRVLRLEGSIYIVHILHISFKPHFLKSISRGDCEQQGGKLLRLQSQYVQEFGLSIRYPQLYKEKACRIYSISSEHAESHPCFFFSSSYLSPCLSFPLSTILRVLHSPCSSLSINLLYVQLLFCFQYPPSNLTKLYLFQSCLFLRTVHSSIPTHLPIPLSVSYYLQALSDLFPCR